MNNFLNRSYREESILALFSLGILLGPPIAIYFNWKDWVSQLPPRTQIFETVDHVWNDSKIIAVSWVNDQWPLSLIAIALVALIALIVIPPVVRAIRFILLGLLKLYIYILPGVVLTWLIYIFSGYEVGQFGQIVTSSKGDSSETEASDEDVEQAGIRDQASTVPSATNNKVVEQPAPATMASSSGTPAENLSDKPSSPSSPPETLTPSDSLDLVHKTMRSRFEGLLGDFRSREEINLGIGMLFSVLGVMILLALVFFGGSRTDFIPWFVPRFSIVLFIQIFAYFFLRLYKENLLDIKYFNNEITNMEYKKAAMDIATKLLKDAPVPKQQADLLSKVCLELLRTERNFVLKKGESAAPPTERDDKSDPPIDMSKQLTKAIKTLADAIKDK
jgi:hypothetical protein